MSAIKEELIRVVELQPDRSSCEEIVRELAFHVMVERGLQDSASGRTCTNAEMRRRIRKLSK